MRYLALVLATFLSFVSFSAAAQDSNALQKKAAVFGDNPSGFVRAASGVATGPGDLYLRTADGKYVQINDANYGVITENIAEATLFGRMQYENKTYYIANSGKNAGYYLSYAVNGYIGTYRWTNAVAWVQDPTSLCLTVDNSKSWTTYEYETGGVKYVVIGNYSYTPRCFLPVPASDSYKTTSLESGYVNENAACVWQPKTKCAPYVTYYTEAQSATLALRVENGKLYQGNALFDTSGADPSHSIPNTSIVVMDPNGRVYASKQNKVYLFHHSSILAGRDVAFAGELQVIAGVIKSVTNCSGHYRPDNSLSQQFKDSLNKQGYSAPFTITSCVPSIVDLNYKELKRKK